MRLTVHKVFFAVLFISLFLMTLRPVTDPDFWWHLRTGELISQTHSIPHIDPFSFTNNGKPWVAHEWLSELFMYGLFQLGNYWLLIFIFSLIITVSFFLAYLRCPVESRPYIAGFIILLGAIAAAPTWGVRPQMISLFLTSLFLYLLTRYRQADKLIFLIPLPFITLLWANLHAGYLMGLCVVAIYIIGGLIEFIVSEVFTKKNSAAPSIKSIFILSVVLIISLLAVLVNPNGVFILVYPFQTLSSQAMQQLIQEWFSPDFHQLMWQPLAWFILAFIGAGMLGKKSISITKILLTLAFGYAALSSVRHVPLFTVVAIPILAEQIDSFVRVRGEVQAPNRLLYVVTPILLFCLLLITSLRFIQVVKGQGKSETGTFPKVAVDWIEKNQPAGNIFNSYGWGGYIIWRLYPEYPVFIDGRADVYGDKFIFDYTDLYRANPGWEQILTENSVHLVLVEPESNLASALLQSTEWDVVFQDKISILFIKK